MMPFQNRSIAFGLSVSIILSIFAPPAWAQQPVTTVTRTYTAEIVKVVGQAEVKRPGQEWRAVREKEQLRTGELLRTGPTGSVKLRVGDVGEFVIRPGSEVKVGEIKQVKTPASAFFFLKKMITRDDVELDLTKGDMRAAFAKQAGRVGKYNVITPVAVAGVRGTKFELDLDGGKSWYEESDAGKGQSAEQTLTAVVLEGEVELTGADWARSLTAGMQLTAQTGAVPGKPVAAPPAKLEEISEDFVDATPPAFSGASTIARPTTTSVKVTWNGATDDVTPAAEILYDLYLAKTSGGQKFEEPSATSFPGASSYTFDKLLPTSHYFVVVRARDATGNRDGNAQQVSTAVEDRVAPVFKGARVVERPEPATVAVKWDPATDEITEEEKIVYDVYAGVEKDKINLSAPVATSEPGATGYVFKDADPEKDYYIIVRARDELGNRDDNLKIVATSQTDVTPPVFSGVGALEALPSGGLRVTWAAAKDNVTPAKQILYDIFLQTTANAQNFAAPHAISGPGELSTDLTDASADEYYYVVVRARDLAGNRDGNTREISNYTEDEEAPTFEGVVAAREVSEGMISIRWDAAEDNRTKAENLVYDVYVSGVSSRQNFDDEPVATSSPGSSRHLLQITREPLPVYYIVVRARDEAGLRDANVREIGVPSPTFIARKIEESTGELFGAYADRQPRRFLDLVNQRFVGVNSVGNVVNYSTLSRVLQEDFRLLSNANIEGSVTSISEAREGQVVANVLWNARYAFAETGRDALISGAQTRLTWDVTQQKVTLLAWQGDAPFGLTDALSGDVFSDIVEIALFDVEGDFVFRIDGDQANLAGRSFIVRGQGFEEGSRVETFDDRSTAWEDVEATTEPNQTIALSFISSTELRIDFQRFIERYYPGENLQHQIRFRVVNPGSENNISNEITKTITKVPGSLRIHDVRIDPPPPIDPNPGNLPFHVEVTFSNFTVTDLGNSFISRIFIAKSGATGIDKAIQFGNFRPEFPDRDSLEPMRISFDAQVVANLSPGSTYELVMVDERGQIARWPIQTGQGGFPVINSMDGDFFFQLGDGLTFVPERRFTLRGANFQEGARVESYEPERGGWTDVTQGGDDVTAFVEFVAHDQIDIRASFQMISRPDDEGREDVRFRVVNPDGKISNEWLQVVEVVPGSLRIANLSISPFPALDPVPSQAGSEYQFAVDFFNWSVNPSSLPGGGAVFITSGSGPDPAFELRNFAVFSPFGDNGPFRLAFTVFVRQLLDSSRTYEVVLVDRRGQQARAAVPVGKAGAPRVSDIQGDFNFPIAGDYTVVSGRYFSISGAGFQQGAVIEKQDPIDPTWRDITFAGPIFSGAVNYIDHTKLDLHLNVTLRWPHSIWGGQATPVPYQPTINLRVRNPAGEVSNELPKTMTITPASFNLVSVREISPGSSGNIKNLVGPHRFEAKVYNMVRPVQIFIVDGVNAPLPVPEFDAGVLDVGASLSGDNAAPTDPQVIYFTVRQHTEVSLPKVYGAFIRDARGQEQWITLSVEP